MEKLKALLRRVDNKLLDVAFGLAKVFSIQDIWMDAGSKYHSCIVLGSGSYGMALRDNRPDSGRKFPGNERAAKG